VCGVTFRNGNNIYTISVCDGAYMEGDIYGHTTLSDEHNDYNYNRIAHVVSVTCVLVEFI